MTTTTNSGWIPRICKSCSRISFHLDSLVYQQWKKACKCFKISISLPLNPLSSNLLGRNRHKKFIKCLLTKLRPFKISIPTREKNSNSSRYITQNTLEKHFGLSRSLSESTTLMMLSKAYTLSKARITKTTHWSKKPTLNTRPLEKAYRIPSSKTHTRSGRKKNTMISKTKNRGKCSLGTY